MVNTTSMLVKTFLFKIKSTKELPKEVVITDPENIWMQRSEERKAILKDTSSGVGSTGALGAGPP